MTDAIDLRVALGVYEGNFPGEVKAESKIEITFKEAINDLRDFLDYTAARSNPCHTLGCERARSSRYYVSKVQISAGTAVLHRIRTGNDLVDTFAK